MSAARDSALGATSGGTMSTSRFYTGVNIFVVMELSSAAERASNLTNASSSTSFRRGILLLVLSNVALFLILWVLAVAVAVALFYLLPHVVCI